jgi:hypothetical protein
VVRGRRTRAKPITAEQLAADAAEWCRSVALLETVPEARAVLDAEPKLREALRTVDSPTARKVLLWLMQPSWLSGDQDGNVGTLLRQYRRWPTTGRCIESTW